jgi:deoxyadenosine/deoxycytidine kinase
MVTCPKLVSERCASTSVKVFSRMQREEGNIRPLFYKVLEEFEEDAMSQATHIIYISVSPELAFDRISERNRSGEQGISLDYLKQLDFTYLLWLREITIPVYVIDGRQSPKQKKKIFSVLQILLIGASGEMMKMKLF